MITTACQTTGQQKPSKEVLGEENSMQNIEDDKKNVSCLFLTKWNHGEIRKICSS